MGKTSEFRRTMKKFALLACSLFLFSPFFAQSRLDVGIYTGLNADYARFNRSLFLVDNQNRLQGYAIGGQLAYRFPGKNGFLELDGRYFDQYLTFEPYESSLGALSGVSHETFTLGIAYRHRLPILKEKWGERLFFSPRIGAELAFIQRSGMSFSLSYSTDLGQYSLSYELPNREEAVKYSPFVGAALEYEFKRGIVVFSRMAYHQGLSRIYEGEFLITLENGTETTEETVRFWSYGSRLHLDFGISIPVFTKKS